MPPPFGPYEFSLCDADFARVRAEVRRRASALEGGWWRRRAEMFAALAAIIAISAGLAGSGLIGTNEAGLIGLVALYAFLGGFWLHKFRSMRIALRAERQIRAHNPLWRVTIDGSGIAIETAEAASQIGWPGVADCRQLGELTFIWFAQFRWIAIPLSAFGERADQAVLNEFIQGQIRADATRAVRPAA